MKSKIALIMVLFAGVFWGSSPLFVSTLSEMGFSSLQSSSIRLTLAAPMLHIVLLASGRKNYKVSIRAIFYFEICGVFSSLAMCICYYYAITATSAAVAAVLLYTAPIFVMIMSIIFFKEKMTAKKAVCLILAVIGCALTSGIIGGIKGSVLGVFIGLLSGIAYSLYSIISTFALKDGASPLACTAFSFTFAALAAQLLTSPVDIIVKITAQPNIIGSVLYLIIFSACTCVIPFVLYTLGLSRLKPDIAAILASTEPVVAALVGIFILKQTPSIYQIIGIIAVISAITILNVNFKSKQQKNSV
jgi:drug/metabolite transporter (DMT)-like permease